MTDVRRFDVICHGLPATLCDAPEGKFVLAEDYDALRARVSELEAAVKESLTTVKAPVADGESRPVAWLNPDNLLSISDYTKRMGCKGSTYPKFSIPCSSLEELNLNVARAALLAAQQQKVKP